MYTFLQGKFLATQSVQFWQTFKLGIGTFAEIFLLRPDRHQGGRRRKGSGGRVGRFVLYRVCLHLVLLFGPPMLISFLGCWHFVFV